MTAVNVSLQVPSRLSHLRATRNGQIVQASEQERIAVQTNQILRFRRKLLFASNGQLVAPLTSASGTINRWRFRCHLGYGTSGLVVQFLMGLHDRSAGNGDRYGKLEVFNTSDVSLGSTEAHFGNTLVLIPSNTPNEFSASQHFIDGLTENTTIHGRFTNENDGRIIAASVWEYALTPDTVNGYAPSNYAINTPIYDADRSLPLTLLTNMWKRNGPHLFNFGVEQDSAAITNSTATDTNVIDNSSTSVSASSPGPTFDLRFMRTLTKTTVDVVFAVFAKISVAGQTGQVKIKNAAGSTLGTVTVNSTTTQWYTTTVSLPATEAKYDFTFAASVVGGNFITFYHLSVYAYHA